MIDARIIVRTAFALAMGVANGRGFGFRSNGVEFTLKIDSRRDPRGAHDVEIEASDWKIAAVFREATADDTVWEIWGPESKLVVEEITVTGDADKASRDITLAWMDETFRPT
jgi:hypothetical protein